MLNRLVKKVPNLLKSIASISYYRPQRSCGKVMFSQVSVILFTGGLCVCGKHPPRQTPPGQTFPVADIPLGRQPTGQTLSGQTPPAQCMLGHTHLLPSACWDTPPAPGSHCSRRYVSYWNAFLFVVKFTSADMCCLSRNNLQFIGVCIMICVNASHHWAIVTSDVLYIA